MIRKLMLIVAIVFFLPSLAAADITKTVKVSGFFGNEACGGYENTSRPTGKDCTSPIMVNATDTDYENVRFDDSNLSTISSAFLNYEVMIYKINVTPFTEKKNITSLRFDYEGSQDSGPSEDNGFDVYLYNFSSGSWILKNYIGYERVTLSNQFISASSRNWTNISFSPNNDTGTIPITLPWQFVFYGASSNTLCVSADGYVGLDSCTSNRLIYGFQDQNLISGPPNCQKGVTKYNLTTADAVIFWDKVCQSGSTVHNISFQIQIFSNNTIKLHYGNITVGSTLEGGIKGPIDNTRHR